MDPIDISSSDSESNVEDDNKIDAERTSRVLPHLGSTSGVRKSAGELFHLLKIGWFFYYEDLHN